MTRGNAFILYDLQVPSSNLPTLITEIVSRPQDKSHGYMSFTVTKFHQFKFQQLAWSFTQADLHIVLCILCILPIDHSCCFLFKGLIKISLVYQNFIFPRSLTDANPGQFSSRSGHVIYSRYGCLLPTDNGLQLSYYRSFFSLLSLFSKIKICLCYHHAVCVSPPPPSIFECLKQSLWNLVYISWHLSPSQWHPYKSLPAIFVSLCESPHIVARQLLGEHVPAATNNSNNRIIVGRVVFYAVRVCVKGK
jgi:hypothetical protein